MLDSEAVFVSRSEEIGLDATEIAMMKTLNIATFGKSASSANYTPGQLDETPLLVLMAKVCGCSAKPGTRGSCSFD